MQVRSVRAPFLILVTFLCSLGVACGSAARTRTAEDVGLNTDNEAFIGDDRRVYDVYVPSGHWDAPAPAPVVVLLHGQRSSRQQLEGGSGRVAPYREWQAVADEDNVLLMIPQGVEGTNGHAGWNDCRSDVEGNPNVDDVAFIASALDQMDEIYRIDRDRIFAVGTSNGGHMALRLAQEMPERLTGIGVIAAGMPANSSCVQASQPISAVFIWGTDDPFAPYDGGEMTSERGVILSANASIQYWIDRNQAAEPVVITPLPDISSSDNSTVERHFHGGGDDNTSVALYQVNGGGHTEPSIAHRYRRLTRRILGEQNHDIEMAAEVWAFFQTS